MTNINHNSVEEVLYSTHDHYHYDCIMTNVNHNSVEEVYIFIALLLLNYGLC